MTLFTQSISGGNATTMKYFYYNLYTYADLIKKLMFALPPRFVT